MRDWGQALDGLDEPVVPGALVDGRDDVELVRVAGVAVHEVRDGGVLPRDVDGAGVDGPDGEGVAVLIELSTGEVDVHGLVRERSGGDGLLPVRGEVGRLGADRRLGVGVAGRGPSGDRVVGPDSAGVVLVGAQAVGCNVGAEPVVAGRLVGVDHDVVALANRDQEPLGVVRLDRNEIGSHDLHHVVVERNADVVVDRDVDQPQAVLLALLDRDLVVRSAALGVLVRSVDENVVSRRRRATILQVLQCDGIDLEGSLVVPVVQHVRSQIDVVVGGGGTIEDHRSNDSVTVLRRKVSVVPRSSKLSRLEAVGLGVTRSKRAFRNSVHTVRANTVVLTNTVPVN